MDAALHSPQPAIMAMLTPRERQVASGLAKGLINKQIADEIGISDRTVETHVHHIKIKLGNVSKFQASMLLREALAGRPFVLPRASETSISEACYFGA